MEPSERNYSSLSEFENLSDSDWLDIASSRASEDDDSIAGFEDSDREDVDGRPASRHSFTSYSSSRDEVVAWEGIIDDASDLETPLPLPDRDELTSFSIAEAARSSSPVADEDPEDERVKAALDQSMMSTLSSSRSNSLATSLVNSTRALRLSFPDPTTSRLESLNHSFEELSHSETHPPAQDAQAHASDAVPLASEPTADPGSYSTPAVPEADIRKNVLQIVASHVKPDLCVVLYGASPLAKGSLVQMLLDKWALSMGFTLTKIVDEASRVVTYTYGAHVSQLSRSICVMDKTGLDQVSPVSSRSRTLTSIAPSLELCSSMTAPLLQLFSSLPCLIYPFPIIPFTSQS